MLVDESDEVLRAIVYGPGSSPDQVQAASEELQRRQQGDADDQPGPVSNSTVDGEGESSIDQPFPEIGLSPRRFGRVSIAVTAMLACGIGVLTTVGYHELQNQGSRLMDSDTDSATSSLTPVFDPNSGQTLYALPTPEEAADQADLDRWFADPQREEDLLPPELEGFNPGSSRFLDELNTEAGVWIAKGTTGDYCLIIAFSDGETSLATCVPPERFSRVGALIGSDDHTVFWDPSTVIVSTTHP